jgi:hypothetical protein
LLQTAQGPRSTVGSTEQERDPCIVTLDAAWNMRHHPAVARCGMPLRSVVDGLGIKRRLDSLVREGTPQRGVLAGAAAHASRCWARSCVAAATLPVGRFT